jgi:hypothetical protein
MTIVHDLIDDFDIPGLRQYLKMKLAKDVDKPNEDGVYPIEYVVSKYDPEKHNMKTRCVLVQTLLNKGFKMDSKLLKEIMEEQPEGKVKQFIEMVLSMKPNKQKDRFARHEQRDEHIREQTSHLRNSNRGNVSGFRQMMMPKSNYSDTELLQLQAIAERNGILTIPTNHLALRIISHLENTLKEYGHYN